MSRGFPSMTALLGLLALAGYQNRDKLINNPSNSMYQITGTVNGRDYVLGINRGHIAQFYPK